MRPIGIFDSGIGGVTVLKEIIKVLPKENYIYPVPYEWYLKYGVRKYGFHGTSHKYITTVMKEKLEMKCLKE